MKHISMGFRITGAGAVLSGLCAGLLCFAVSCRPDDPEIRTGVETGTILEIGPSTCEVAGEILSVGESGISSHGFVWSETPGPDLEQGWHNDMGEAYSEGTFRYTIRDLDAATTYHVRAYAIGKEGVVYGTERTFTTLDTGLPSLITFSVYDFSATGGFSGGNITDDGGGEITASGICWSTGRFPDLDDTHSDEGGGHTTFESYLGGLQPYTVYYVRAYATNQAGTGYGQEVAFRTYWDDSPVTDIDGNEYPTVQIGDQVWMAMSLQVTRFADGTPVDLVEEDASWEGLEADAAAYCFYENRADQEQLYGALYTWSAASGSQGDPGTGEQIQGVCPDGWHLPGDEEWKELEMELGMTRLTADGEQWRGYEEGGMLKLQGTDYWNEPNEMANNSSGFSAAPSGTRNGEGAFSGRGDYAVFWSATPAGDTTAWVRALHTMRGEIKREPADRKAGYAIRCIMNE